MAGPSSVGVSESQGAHQRHQLSTVTSGQTLTELCTISLDNLLHPKVKCSTGHFCSLLCSLLIFNEIFALHNV